jgi:hypothetical protein
VADRAAGRGLHQGDTHVVVGQLVVHDYRARSSHRNRDSLVVDLIESGPAWSAASHWCSRVWGHAPITAVPPNWTRSP